MRNLTNSLAHLEVDHASYSKIIQAAQYNRIISEEHLYIHEADLCIFECIREKIQDVLNAEVVELGCGPGRLFPLMSEIKNAHFTAVDYDTAFLAHAQTLLPQETAVHLVYSDLALYRHPCPVDIFFSQGVHHHIPKGQATQAYLLNIYEQLKPNGYYILSDEFLPNYENETERASKAIIWYAHIIASGLSKNQTYLAQEEAKTLLDDLGEGCSSTGFKTEAQIRFILEAATKINLAALAKDLPLVNQLVAQLMTKIKTNSNSCPSGDNTLDLSRGDYKIGDRVLREEVETLGFTVEASHFFGASRDIGGMVVYLLRK